MFFIYLFLLIIYYYFYYYSLLLLLFIFIALYIILFIIFIIFLYYISYYIILFYFILYYYIVHYSTFYIIVFLFIYFLFICIDLTAPLFHKHYVISLFKKNEILKHIWITRYSNFLYALQYEDTNNLLVTVIRPWGPLGVRGPHFGNHLIERQTLHILLCTEVSLLFT